MPLQPLQQLAHRPIVWNRVWHRHNRLKPEHALFIARHHRPLIRPFPTRILHIVEAFAVRFPDIDLDAFDRLAGGVFDVADHKTGLAVRIVRNEGAVALNFGFVGVEGTEDCAFGALRWFGVVDAVDKEGEAEDVGEENEFLYVIVSK